MRISDWSSDVCSSDLTVVHQHAALVVVARIAVHMIAAAALPFFGIEIDAQVFGDQDFHENAPFLYFVIPAKRVSSAGRPGSWIPALAGMTVVGIRPWSAGCRRWR